MSAVCVSVGRGAGDVAVADCHPQATRCRHHSPTPEQEDCQEEGALVNWCIIVSKSWELMLKVLESPGKNILESRAFFSGGSNGLSWSEFWTANVQILPDAEFSAADYTLNVVGKCRFFFVFKHSQAPKRSWKIFHGGPGKVQDFLWVIEWERWFVESAVCIMQWRDELAESCSCSRTVYIALCIVYSCTELVHRLSLSSATTFSKLLRKIFGRFLFLGKDLHFQNSPCC